MSKISSKIKEDCLHKATIIFPFVAQNSSGDFVVFLSKNKFLHLRDHDGLAIFDEVNTKNTSISIEDFEPFFGTIELNIKPQIIS